MSSVEQIFNAEWCSTHRELSEQDLRFRERAQSDPRLLHRSCFTALERNRDLLKYRIQPWPTFVGRPKLEQLKSASLAVCNLVRSIPQRVFRNEADKVCEFYGLDAPTQAEIVLAPPNGIESSVARGDFIDSRDGFKCIEFNFTPNLGGWETSVLVQMHMEVPATAEFVRDMGVAWSYTPTLRRFFLHLIADVRSQGLLQGGELNVAFVFDPQPETTPESVAGVLRHLNSELLEACRGAGLAQQGRVLLCHYPQLERRRGAIFYGDLRVHAIAEFSAELTAQGVFRAFKAGALALYNGPIEPILSSKKNIALLSENEATEVFSPEERAQIRAYVPWTRRVLPGRVDFHGEQVALTDLLERRRESLVLKEASSFGGKGVTLGRFASASEWAGVLRTALATGRYVVQELVESLPYLYQSGDIGCSVHDVIWGPFVFGQDYGGMILRMQPKAAGGAVNLSLEATEGIVLEV